MRYALVLAAAVMVLGQSAAALSCNFTGTVTVGNTTSAPGECWDLSGWAEADAKGFCTNVEGGVNRIGSQQVASCPAGAVGQCLGASYQAPRGESVPEAYYAQMPPAMAKQVKAKVAEMNAQMAPLQRYNGKPIAVYYYADPHGVVKLADQQKNCVGKGGRWGQ